MSGENNIVKMANKYFIYGNLAIFLPNIVRRVMMAKNIFKITYKLHISLTDYNICKLYLRQVLLPPSLGGHLNPPQS